jgi:ATP-dependent DNA helicase RecG
MLEVNIWDDGELESQEVLATQDSLHRESNVSKTVSLAKTALITIDDGLIKVYSKVSLRDHKLIANDLNSLYGLTEDFSDSIHCFTTALTNNNCFVWRYILTGLKSVDINQKDRDQLGKYANRSGMPLASIDKGAKFITVKGPRVQVYFDIIKKAGGHSTTEGFKVPLARVLDLETLIEKSQSLLPKIKIDESVLNLSRESLANFDGTLDSLKKVSTNELNVVAINSRTWGSKTKATTEERLKTVKIESAYDLLFNLPKKFIDKSNPQEFEYLYEGDEVTLIGNIINIGQIPNNMGIKFELENKRGNKVKCNFWRQQWLSRKFKIGDEVLITGKANWFRKNIEIGGISIEHADEAAIIPIVPVYRQWPSKGITTNLLMSANRELISRANNIKIPPYLESKMDNFTQTVSELHFPSSLDKFKEACDYFAYQELVYMQLLILETRKNLAQKKGLVQLGRSRDLQNRTVKTLPFTLTNDQIQAVKQVNQLLAQPTPSQVLLNGDVGSGKTLVADLAALKSVDSGYQVAMLAPTEVLARQLHGTFMNIADSLENSGEMISIAFLSGQGKAADRKPLLEKIKNGEIDVVVGTTSVISDKVKYNNLGLVIVDEQQKLGAAQRTKLLDSRLDNSAPDLLMMTATPIPRSTAQVFYGDVTMIKIDEKPKGRLPIKTEWIKEDPQEILQQIMNPIWSDIRKEAQAGNQTFIITPMVKDSEKIDAASVEKTFKQLSTSIFQDLKVGFIHGQIPKDEQASYMNSFRNKEYDVLVASTVVEVGVDIPDATRVVIMSADRLGASSLHQIRGRVGRNSKSSKCYLVSMGLTDSSQERLHSLVNSDNGFDIAMADLNVRGEGKMFGTEQTGSSEMIFASLLKHSSWIEDARTEANHILESEYSDLALSDARQRFNNPERFS